MLLLRFLLHLSVEAQHICCLEFSGSEYGHATNESVAATLPETK